MVRSTGVGNLRYIAFVYDCTSIQALSCRPCQYLSRMSSPYHSSDLLFKLQRTKLCILSDMPPLKREFRILCDLHSNVSHLLPNSAVWTKAQELDRALRLHLLAWRNLAWRDPPRPSLLSSSCQSQSSTLLLCGTLCLQLADVL
jgi:hypothetical protein